MRFISLIDNPFSRVEPTCPSVRIEIKLFLIVSDGVYWTALSKLASTFVLALIEEKSTPLNFLYFSTQLSLKILAKQSKTAKTMLAFHC